MADAKISALPAATSIAAADVIPFTNVLSSVTQGVPYNKLLTNPSMIGTVYLGNSSAIDTQIKITNTQDSNFMALGKQGSGTYGAFAPGDANIYTTSPGLAIMADTASGVIKFATGGKVEVGRIDATGNLLMTSTLSGIGYGVGAGGTVTQSVGGTKEQAIALNRPSGKFFLSNSVMAASVITSVLFGNSVMGVTDLLVLNYIGNGRTGTNMRYYSFSPSMVAPGSAVITLTSHNNFADTSSIFGSFAVIKGAIT